MKRVILAGLAALVAGSATHAQMNPQQMEWGPAPDGLPPGALLAVLSGDPGKQGMFTIRLRFPAGYKVPPHHHPSDELVTVIGGQLALGMGNRFSERKATALVRGGYAVAPANMNHYAFTKGGAEIQITAHGPFQIVYVNARDDPRRKR
ncbi:MAG TPA: cupin domain-containing protein [Sphingomicrobium sp.]|jgi:quercetin dioxygenase-like cupin family protein|nr:cupin domain-containing protein [Sphingomicrobium sp.]